MRPPIYYERSDQFIKKRTWTPEEDEKLVNYIRRYGIWNCTEMPKAAGRSFEICNFTDHFFGLMRSGKSCRLRWMNYLRPNIRLGNYNKEEEDTILKLHERLGNKWATSAARLPGRTDNDVKNYWHTHLKKRIKINHDQKKQTNVPMQGIDSKQYDNSPQKEQKPAISGVIPVVASEPELSSLTNSSASSSAGSPRVLCDDDQVSETSMESFLFMEDNSWSSFSNNYSLWFEVSATYLYTSNEELARDFWDGLFVQ